MTSGLAFAAVLGFSTTAQAHFYLMSPESMTEQNDLGNPQKAPNCGDPGNATLTGAVTTFTAGETISITIDETIFHPGHYRIALAMNDPSELPDPPEVTPTPQDDCAMTTIQDPAVFPVLADGLGVHDSPYDGPQTFEVTLPDDVECDNCTLQILEYMSSHGAPCFYYHCATINIEPDPSNTSDGGGSTGGPDPTTTGGGTSGTSSTTDDSGGTSGGTSTSGTSSTSGGTTGSDATATGTGTDSAGVAEDEGDSSGCAVSPTRAPLGASFLVLAVLGLRRRLR